MGDALQRQEAAARGGVLATAEGEAGVQAQHHAPVRFRVRQVRRPHQEAAADGLLGEAFDGAREPAFGRAHGIPQENLHADRFLTAADVGPGAVIAPRADASLPPTVSELGSCMVMSLAAK